MGTDANILIERADDLAYYDYCRLVRVIWWNM